MTREKDNLKKTILSQTFQNKNNIFGKYSRINRHVPDKKSIYQTRDENVGFNIREPITAVNDGTLQYEHYGTK